MKQKLILITALFAGTMLISNLLADDEENNTGSQSLNNGELSYATKQKISNERNTRTRFLLYE